MLAKLSEHRFFRSTLPAILGANGRGRSPAFGAYRWGTYCSGDKCCPCGSAVASVSARMWRDRDSSALRDQQRNLRSRLLPGLGADVASISEPVRGHQRNGFIEPV